MKTRQHSGFFKRRSVLDLYLGSFELTAGRVDQNYRTRYLCFCDLVRDLPRLRNVMQYDAKTELFLKPQNRHDVVMPMRVPMNNPLAVEDLDQSFHREVARRHLRRIAIRFLYLVAIF